MRESMARLTPTFSADRTVREYTEQHYLPAAAAYRERAKNKGAAGKQVIDWQHDLEQKWERVHFGAMKAETKDGQHVFEVQLSLGDLDPNAVRVELFTDGADGDPATSLEMKLLTQPADTGSGHVYGANVPAIRPVGDYTARLIPRCEGVAIPLEVANILWQR
jgi:starch phosphorylase